MMLSGHGCIMLSCPDESKIELSCFGFNEGLGWAFHLTSPSPSVDSCFKLPSSRLEVVKKSKHLVSLRNFEKF